MVTGMQDLRIKWFLVLLIFISGAVIRFCWLEDLPDLEHDEALICLGARDIADGKHLPLTGDKVYEGPLLEYSCALAMKIAGNSVLTVRILMAVFGSISLLVIFWVGVSLSGWITGFLSMLLLIISPWHMLASRTIYACNLSVLLIPLFLVFYIRFLKDRHLFSLMVAASALGLAANGRFTAYLIIIPVWITLLSIRNNRKSVSIITFSVFALLPSLPVLIYNFFNGFPSVNILSGGGQGHLMRDPNTMFYRISGFIKTMFAALAGKNYWVDAEIPSPILIWVFPILFFLGVSRMLILKTDNNLKRWFLLPVFFLFILLPLITKPIQIEGIDCYHPHYMDLLFPFAILISAFALAEILKWKKYTGFFLLILVFALQLFHLSANLIPGWRENGLPGRWSNHYSNLVNRINDTVEPENCFICVPWNFGEGYPQIAFLLPEFNVLPVIDKLYGIKNKDGTWVKSRIVFVSNNPLLYQEPWQYLSLPNSSGVNSGAWIVDSPGFRLNGLCIINDDTRVKIKTSNSVDKNIPWPGIQLFFGDDSYEISVQKRDLIEKPLESVLAAVKNVTVRHKTDLEQMANIVVAHRISGFDLEQKEWELTIASRPDPDGQLLLVIKNDRELWRGSFFGESIFY
ncbi:glycosyltransferase family 39 protein [bacterium]|nr:glycosyltransferase family 39 protein [bacterium]